MNWKSTVVLVILATVAGLWLWKGDAWAPKTAPHSAPPDPEWLTALEANFTPDTITRIEVTPPEGDAFTLTGHSVTGPDGKPVVVWKQPGDWPLRTVEVNELVATLGNLRTRFQPVTLPEKADLTVYGLADAQKPVVVKVTAGGKEYSLKFGEPALNPGESEFTRPAFMRVGEAQEVLKLGPDVMPVVRRPAEAYRRRQLFTDSERVKLAGSLQFTAPGAPPEVGPPTMVSLPGANIATIHIVSTEGPKILGFVPWPMSGNFTLRRIAPTPGRTVIEKNAEASVQLDRFADAWALDAPVKDRPDPAKLQQVLAAVPELWVEDFIPQAQGWHAEQPFAIARLLPIPGDSLVATAVRLHPEVIPDPREELKKPKRTVSVTLRDGKTVTVKLGGIAKVTTREEKETIPGPPGMPPRMSTRKVETIYRYAQVEGNPQLFTVSTEKFDDLFAKAGDLVDSRVAGFNTEEVQTIAVAQPGKPPVVLTRKKGDPDATKAEEQQDRWFIEQAPNPLLADSGRVEEFIGRLSSFRGNNDSDLYFTDPKARGLDPATSVVVTVTVREKRPKGAPDAPAREYKLLIGAPDFAAGKLPVQLAGWPRITLLSDRLGGAPPTGWLTPKLFPERLEPVFRRDAITYLSRKLFDTAGTKLTGVTVDGSNGFVLKQIKTPEGRDVWKLTAPVASDADSLNAGQLIGLLSTMEATEFVSDGANPAAYGLDKPKLTALLAFDNARTYRLDIGSPRPGKQEVFARLDSGAVFGLPMPVSDQLASGALKLLPLQVWVVQLDRLTAVELTRFDVPTDSFALTKDGTNWKLTGPFTVGVSFLDAQPVVAPLSVLPAMSYEALSAPDPAKYGFDKPFAKVKLTYTDKTPEGDRPVSKTLVIGGVTPGGQDRFAKLEDPTAPVFVLPASYLAAVRVSPLALLDRNLLGLDAAKIAKVQITGDKPENAVTLVKNDKGVWKAEGSTFAVDPVVVSQFVDTVARLPVEQLVAYGDAVKWAEYGLDKPEYTITVTLGGEKPETHKIQLSISKTLTGLTGSRFARVDDGKAVAAISFMVVPVLTRAKLDFADRTLLTFKPEELLGLSRVKGKEELDLAPATVGWDIVKPAKTKADQVLMDELADTLSKLRAEKIAAFGKKEDVYKQFGLEPPEAVVTLTVGEKAEQKVLRLGRPVDAAKPDGDRFAAIDAAGADAAVAILPAALSNRLLAPAVSFRDRTVSKFVDADKLVLERGPRKVTFAKVNGTWKVTAPLMTDAEQAALDDLVNELAKLRASDWVAEKPAPAELKAFGLENPEAIWTVSNGDKVELTLRLGKTTPDGRVYATAGTTGFVALLGQPQTAKVLGEYRTRKPWTLDAFQAESIEITRGDKTFALQKRGMAWVDPTAPTDAIDPRAVTELLGSLTALQVDRYAVDTDGNPQLFGLEKPEATIAVTLKDGEKRVLAVGGFVGGTGDKQRYARVVDKGRADVFVLSAADTTRLTRDRATYAQKK